MRYFKLLLILAITLVTCGEFAQAQSTQGEWGYGASASPKTDWRASWIWLPEEVESDMMLARKVFQLSKKPKRAMLSITASSRYQLYVNGQWIGEGPARSAAHHQSYDVLNITDQLRVGKNVLAIRVHHQREALSYYGTSRAGLLAQLDCAPNNAASMIQTDTSWKVAADASWMNDSPRMAVFHLEVNDRVDLRRGDSDWQAVDFNSRMWKKALVLRRNTGWPTPQKNDRSGHLIAPWTKLIGRDIPYLNESIIKGQTPVYIGSVASPNGTANFPADAWIDAPPIGKIDMKRDGVTKRIGPTVLGRNEEGENRVVVYDLGDVKNGRPFVEITAPEGTVVDVISVPYLVEGSIRSHIVASNYVDRIIFSGKRERWESFYMKPARWVAVVFRHLEGEAKLHQAGVVQSKYPFEKKGFFKSPDAPELERLWEATAKTIEVCTTDAYTDNYRERRQYVQTNYYANLGNYPVFGDYALQRRYLIQSADEQLGDGLMPAYGPRHGDDFMVILDSNCFWFRGLCQYLLYSGDRETVEELLPAGRRLLKLLNGFTNKAGLMDSPPLSYWLDHAMLDRRGANFVINTLYLAALEDFVKVLGWLDEDDADIYKRRANALRQSLGEQFWDAKRGLFVDAVVDGVQSTQFSEHTNAMAMAFKIAGDEQRKKVARELSKNDHGDFIRRESGVIMATPVLMYFLSAGLYEEGHGDAALELLWDRFSHMLEPGGNGTLWEEWWLDGTGRTGTFKKHGSGRSDAQTESAFFSGLFTQYILGIEPTMPGLQEVSLRYYPSERLHRRHGAIPSPLGLLEVQWKVEPTHIEVIIKSPDGMNVRLDLASMNADQLEGQATSRLRLNGEKVNASQIKDGFLNIPAGQHTVQVVRSHEKD